MKNLICAVLLSLACSASAIEVTYPGSGGGTGGSATNVVLRGAQPNLVGTNGTGDWTILGNVSTGVSNWVTSVSGSGTNGAQTSVVNPAQYVWMASIGIEPNVGVTLVTSSDGTNFTRAQTPIVFNYDQYTNSYKGPSNRRWSLIETNGQWFSASAHDGRFGSASSGDIDIWRSGDLTNWTRAAIVSPALSGMTNVTYGVNWFRDTNGATYLIASTDTNTAVSGSAHIWSMLATDSTLTNFASPSVIKVGDVSQEGFMVRGTNGIYKLYYRCRWPGLEWLLATNSANNLTTIFSACQTNLGWGTFGASADAGGLSLVKVSGTHWRAYSYSESGGTNYFTDSFDDLATWANWSQLSGVPNYVTGESYSGVYGSGITLSPTSPAGATNRLQTLGSDTVYTSAIDSPLLKARTVNAGNVAVTGGGVFGSLFSAGTITGGGDVRAKHVRSSHFVSLAGDGTTVDAELLDGVWNAVGYVGIFVGDGAGITNISGGSSGTFDYAALTNKPTPILLLATNQGSSLSNAFAIAAGDSSVTLVTNANGRLVTITSTGGTNGGGGAAVVSNSVVVWSVGAWFTNSTAYYLVVNAPVILTTDNTGANSGQMNFNVDTNLNGVTDWFLRSSIAVDSATTVLSTDIRYLGGIVPPNSAFQYEDVSINGTATMDGVMELTFLSTGSGSGTGIATNGGTGINNRFTNTVFAGTIGFSNDVTIAGNISVAGTFNVSQLNATNVTFTGKSNAFLWVQSDSSVVATSIITSVIVGFNNNPNFGTTTRYFGLQGGQSGGVTTELAASTPVLSGRYSNFVIKLYNAGAGTNLTATIMTNGVATHITCSALATGGGTASAGSDTTHMITLTNGTPLSVRLVGDNTTGSASGTAVSWALGFKP